LDDGHTALAAAGRYAELAALLQYNRQHEAALQLLRQLSQDPASLPVPPSGAAVDLRGLPGVWAAVRCVGTPGRRGLALVRQHAASGEGERQLAVRQRSSSSCVCKRSARPPLPLQVPGRAAPAGAVAAAVKRRLDSGCGPGGWAGGAARQRPAAASHTGHTHPGGGQQGGWG
jgi:hypothetical protein